MAEKLDLDALEKLADAARECLQSGKHWMRIEERAVMVEKLAQLAIAGLRAQHAGEAVPFGWVSPTQGNYFTRNKTVANRIGGLMPVYAEPRPALVPEGFVLAPKNPTEAMRLAPAKDRPGFSRVVATEIWNAMLAAAPQPPAPATTATPAAGEGEHE